MQKIEECLLCRCYGTENCPDHRTISPEGFFSGHRCYVCFAKAKPGFSACGKHGGPVDKPA